MALLMRRGSSAGLVWPDFDVCKRLLSLLATVWHVDEKITALKAMSICNKVSSTTIQGRLKSLHVKGVIVLVNVEIDTRIKYVTPMKIAFQYFAQIGHCMEEANAI
jgi:hypothetical protein